MRDAVIVEAVRTPVGKRNGVLSGVHPVDLSGHVLRALAERSGVDPALVDDVIWGCVGQVGEQTFDLGRHAVLAAGWPLTVPGVTVDRQCGSSQQSAHFAAAGLIAGQYDVVVAGGVESMSRVPMGSSIAGANPFGSVLESRYGGVTGLVQNCAVRTNEIFSAAAYRRSFSVASEMPFRAPWAALPPERPMSANATTPTRRLPRLSTGRRRT